MVNTVYLCTPIKSASRWRNIVSPFVPTEKASLTFQRFITLIVNIGLLYMDVFFNVIIFKGNLNNCYEEIKI